MIGMSNDNMPDARIAGNPFPQLMRRLHVAEKFFGFQ